MLVLFTLCPGGAKLTDQNNIDGSILLGREKAEEVLERRRMARARRADALSRHTQRIEVRLELSTPAGPLAAATLQTAGFLVAVGDSWFDYPLYDIV